MIPTEPFSDTSPEIVDLRDILLRGQSSVEMAQRIREVNRTVELLMREGVRARHPGLSDAELLRQVGEIRLGEELARGGYGPR